MSQGEAAAPSRPGCLRRALDIVVTALVVLAVGAGVFYFRWYRPLAAENQSMTAELETLRPLKGENEQLRTEVRQAGLRLQVLEVLVDVNAGRALLALGRPEQAADSLSSAGDRLQVLADQVERANVSQVVQMRDRLGLALGELRTDAFAAQSDLVVLANDLSQLAEALSQ